VRAGRAVSSCVLVLVWRSPPFLLVRSDGGRRRALPRPPADTWLPWPDDERAGTVTCAAGCAAAVVPAGGAPPGRVGRRLGPFPRDDRVELRREQVRI